MTSESFEIFAWQVGGGTLALSPMPKGAGLQTLMDWRPDLVLTMTEMSELALAGIGDLGTRLTAQRIGWHHLPVPDFGVPVAFDWGVVPAHVLPLLATGGKVLVHCKGGCGRSGMMVLRLMIAAGESPDGALKRLRDLRPCAVETAAQLAWATQDGRVG